MSEHLQHVAREFVRRTDLEGPKRIVQELLEQIATLEGVAEPRILERWEYSGQPSVSLHNHAVDVANANYRVCQRLRQQLAEADQQRKDLAALVEKWRADAARINSFHATMGTGYTDCADQLAALLKRVSEPTP